jgi:DNA-binding transcriptional ArsR family regulator
MNMSARAPVALLPLFRSEAQYRLIGELFTAPGREFSVGDLASRIAASHATVSREVSRLEEAGLLRSRSDARRRLVTAETETPVFIPLRDLMFRVYGVPAVIREEFASFTARVVIFGSWAARWDGQPGKVPNDVDVLVVGETAPTDAWEAASRATRRIGMEVNVVVRTEEEWSKDPTGFAAQIRSQPVIDVTSDSHDNVAAASWLRD